MVAPVWVHLFSLLVDFSDPEILEGIDNSIGRFVKVANSTRGGRSTSYARTYIYMNIIEPLLDILELEYQDEVWRQVLNYEHIPFRCKRCHEYMHLYKAYPLNQVEEKEIGPKEA